MHFVTFFFIFLNPDVWAPAYPLQGAGLCRANAAQAEGVNNNWQLPAHTSLNQELYP